MRKVFIVLILILNQVLTAQVTGVVFRDFDGDGIKGVTEPFVAGVEVSVYDVAGALCGSATTSHFGLTNYSVSGCSGLVRVEFVIPPTACEATELDYGGLSGQVHGTSVQFLSDGSNGIANFALSNSGDYVTPATQSPLMFVTHLLNGDPLAAGSAVASSGAIYSLPYTASGTTPNETTVATAGQLGSVWGLAYSRHANQLFSSAVLRRHAGLGPLGIGGIYLVNPSTNSVVNFANLDALGFNTNGTGAYNPISAGSIVTFTDVVGSNTDRGLPPVLNIASRDVAALEQIGKVGIGDIDLSEDGRFLFCVNLYDKKLYKIDLQNAANPVPPTAANITSYPIPDPACSGGSYRPWALKVYNGMVYVGVICDAQTSQLKTDLSASIYRFDLSTNTFTGSILDFSLGDFDKGEVSDFTSVSVKGWYPWVNDFSVLRSGSNTTEYPQPILSDIEFDNDGSIIMGFIDRAAMQFGWYNYNVDVTDNQLYLGFSGGDILRAYNTGLCTFELESNGKEGPSSSKPATGGANNNQGPGGGEFYHQESTGTFGHYELSQGGLAMVKGSDLIVHSMYDPNQFDSYGLQWLSNSNGTEVQAYEINFTGNNGNTPNDGTFSKASSLGDLEFIGALPPLEVGNRVWEDTDGDGIQDPNEPALDGVVVELYDVTNGNALVGSATTANGGQYYFGGSGNVNMLTGNLLFGNNYELRIAITSADAASANALTSITLTDQGTDLHDSDGTLSGPNAVKTFTTGSAGENDHSFDFGFRAVICSLTPPAIAVTNNICPSITGSFDIITDCAAGSHIEYSTDGGTGWSTTVPTWADGVSVIARCIDDVDVTCFSTATDPPVVATLTPCTGCSITVEVSGNTPSAACDPAQPGKYILTVHITYSGLPGTDLDVNGIVVTTDGSGDQIFNIPGYNADGLVHDIVVTAVGDPTCSFTGVNAYTAPSLATCNATDNPCENPVCNPVPTYSVCDNGSSSQTLSVDPSITDIIWYNSAGTIVGTGNNLIVDITTEGMQDGTECFYSKSLVVGGCYTGSCCPVIINTTTCCPSPNCSVITVIPND